MRRKSPLAVPFLLILALLPSHAGADAIDDYLQAEMAARHIPGLSLAIMRDGEPVRVQGYGYADLEHQVPVHPDTLFQSGSIGKQFTATIALLLVQDGVLELDAPVRRYLPAAPESWHPITLRNLLNHTGGLGSTDLDLHREYDDDALLKAYYATPLAFPAGRRWSYSNEGYATVGILIKKVTGRFYGDLLAERVFAPLGMRTARVISDQDVIRNRASGYEVEDGIYRNQDWVSVSLNRTSDGSLYLSALDYVQWNNAVRKHALLKPELWQEVYRAAPLQGGSSYPYGMGWMLAPDAVGGPLYHHGGAWQGFRTMIRRYQADGVSFVLLANSTSANVGTLMQGVAERYDPRYAPAPATPVTDESPALTDAVQRMLTRIAAGQASPADYAGSDRPPEAIAERIERTRKLQAELGTCKPLQLYAQQANGDLLSRSYRSSCRNGVQQADATIEAASGNFQSLGLRKLERIDAPL